MPNFVFRLLISVKSLLLSRVSYLDKVAYQIQTNSTLVPQKATDLKVLIISRHNYNEQIQWLPVGRLSEAKKLVKFSQSSRGKGCFYILGKPVNGKTPVIWYQLKPQALSYNALLILPETALLGLFCQAGEVLTYQSPDVSADVYVTRTQAGTVSVVKGGLLQTAEQFMLAQGGIIQNCITLNSKQHQQHLTEAVFKLQHLSLTGLINRTAFRHSGAKLFFSRYVWPLAAAVTLYLIIASQLVSYQLQQSQEQVQLATREANQLLVQRENIESMFSRYQQLQQILPGEDNLLQLWQVLAPLYQQGVLINTLQQSQQEVTLNIEAPSAIEALQLLVKQPGVTQASLKGTIRRQDDMDMATFSFVLQQAVL